MATVDKAFRIKNGLVVEGSTATVNGSDVLTEASTEFLQDTTAGMFDGSQNGIAFSYNDTTGKITATVSTDPIFADKITFEGATSDNFETILQVVDPTADIVLTLPNVTGTIALITDIPTLDTDDVSEAGNLYFTNQRALNATASAYDVSGAAATAQTNAETFATSADTTLYGTVTTDIATAKSAAISDAAADATTKANAAQSAAAADATTKANAAETAAKAYTDSEVAALVDSAPEVLDTLNELAAAIADNPNYASDVANLVATKANTSYVNSEISDLDTAAQGYASAAQSAAAADATTKANAAQSAAEAAANGYTNGRETAITTAYQAYADTAQTDAEDYADGLVDDIKDGTTTFTQIALTDALIGTATTSLSTTSATVVDSWSATNYSSAKYIVQMKNGNDIEVLEVLITVDGNSNVYITEYADVISNAQIGTTDADLSGGNVRLLVTSTNGTTVKVHKTLIEA
jgi:hypothetical protein